MAAADDVYEEMVRLVVGSERNMHVAEARKGPMVHGPHPNNGRKPSTFCSTPCGQHCQARYPRPVASNTHRGQGGYTNLKRTQHDIFIVAYHPWLLLYFKSHINVEIAATVHVIDCLPDGVLLPHYRCHDHGL